MGTSKYFTIALMVFFLLSGCKKDDGLVTFSLQTSNYQSQEKAHMEYANGVYYTCWNDGDEIKINGATATVTITSSGASATVTDGEVSGNNYYAIYPASCVRNSVSGRSVITLPRVYEYVENGGKQVLTSPMAAKAVSVDGRQVLFFKNLCSQLKIHVAGNVTLHNINIHSNNSYLSGTAPVRFDDSEAGDIDMPRPTSSLGWAEKYVSIHFSGSGYNTPEGGKDFYIPVPKLPRDETLHVVVVATNNSTGEKGVYMRSTTTSRILPANLVIPMNIFPTLDNSCQIATAATYLGGNRESTTWYRTYINPGFSAINNSTAIEASFSGESAFTSNKNEYLYGMVLTSNDCGLFYLRRATTAQTYDLVQTRTIRNNPLSSFLAVNSPDRIYLSHNAQTLMLKNLSSSEQETITINSTASYTVNQADKPFYILGAGGDANRNHFSGRCFYFRVSDENGVCFDGIPATVPIVNWNSLSTYGLTSGMEASSGVVPCMYDMVSGKFFSSAQVATVNDTPTPIHFRYGTDMDNGRNVYYYPENDR